MKKKWLCLLSLTGLLTLLGIVAYLKSDFLVNKSAGNKGNESILQVEERKEQPFTTKARGLLNQTPNSESDSEEDFSLVIQEVRQQELSSLKEQMGNSYSDINILQGEEHTIVYIYTFAETPTTTFDEASLKPILVESMKPVIDYTKERFPDVKVEIIYQNPDHSEFAKFIITREETEKME